MEARETRPYDYAAIEALIKRARFTSPALWCWGAHLTDRGFLVVEMDGGIEGALLAASDESPVAWVRLAAVGPDMDVGQWLDVSLPPILRHLRAQNVHELAWMDDGEWARPSLEAWGFRAMTEVMTLSKTDRTVPPVGPRDVRLRPANESDFAALAAIDRKAFVPAWWRSEGSMRRRAATASRFSVVERRGEVIGYAERELHPPEAHLNRIAVDPDHQGQGIGALLLEHALVAMWRRGAETVSLNTQRSNRRSRRLYDRFGFEATGDCVTVWVLPL
jgi:ribosomal-protein-alanine N-acetyltransferase